MVMEMGHTLGKIRARKMCYILYHDAAFLYPLKVRKEVTSLQFSLSVVSVSLQPHGLQHARPPCPSPTPRV